MPAGYYLNTYLPLQTIMKKTKTNNDYSISLKKSTNNKSKKPLPNLNYIAANKRAFFFLLLENIYRLTNEHIITLVCN